MLIVASVLLRVTMVGLETTFVLFCCFRAEMMILKSAAENTAEVNRSVPPVLVRPIRLLTALLTALAAVFVSVSVSELVVPFEVEPVVPLLVPKVVPLLVEPVVPLVVEPDVPLLVLFVVPDAFVDVFVPLNV